MVLEEVHTSRLTAEGMDDCGGESGSALFRAAQAHIERVVLDCFVARIAEYAGEQSAGLTPILMSMAVAIRTTILEVVSAAGFWKTDALPQRSRS